MNWTVYMPEEKIGSAQEIVVGKVLTNPKKLL